MHNGSNLPVALGFSRLFPLYKLLMFRALYFCFPFSPFEASPVTADMALILVKTWTLILRSDAEKGARDIFE